MTSDRRLHANRLNAQKSTGPRTAEGKARSSQNATSHGFFCRDAVLPGEDAALFEDLRERFIDAERPQTISELQCVDTIVRASWKLRRLQESELHLHDNKESEIKAKSKSYIERMRDEGRGRSRPDVSDKLVDIAKQNMDGSVSVACSLVTLDRSFERLAMLEIRLFNQISRARRDLRQLRKDRQQIDELPPSPFSKHRMNSLEERYEDFCRRTQSRTGYRPPPLEGMEPRQQQKAQNEANDREPARGDSTRPLTLTLSRGERGPEAEARGEMARDGTVWHGDEQNAQNEANAGPGSDASGAGADARTASQGEARGESSSRR